MKTHFTFRHYLILCSFALLITLIPQYLQAQTFLEIPVKLEVEKGSVDDVVVKVIKDGKDAFTQSGASKMRFKLDFNKKYSLVFTKQGYVTKTIEINTSAPEDRIKRKFDPYRIGVKLFLNDSQNAMVYNQPVAKIAYDETLDEFNFATDYSKSILSAFKKQDLTITKDTADHADDIAKVQDNNATNSSGSERLQASSASSGTGDDNKTNAIASSQINQDNHDSQPLPTASSGSDSKATNQPHQGNDSRSQSGNTIASDNHLKTFVPNGDASTKTSSHPSSGTDGHIISKPLGGDDFSAKQLTASTGNDLPATNITSSHGTDPIPPSVVSSNEDEKITREDIVEKNRVITRIRVIRGNKITEYSRVNYSWGGNFFFLDNKTSISHTCFAQNTGISN